MVQVQQMHWEQQPLPQTFLKTSMNQNQWSLCLGSARRTVFGTSLWPIGWKHNLRYRFICMRGLQRKRLPKPIPRLRCQDWIPSTAALLGLQKLRPSRETPKGHPNVPATDQCRTTILWLRNIRFFRDGKLISHNNAELEFLDCVSLTFEKQK
jgi:hypothetical protein